MANERPAAESLNAIADGEGEGLKFEVGPVELEIIFAVETQVTERQRVVLGWLEVGEERESFRRLLRSM